MVHRSLDVIFQYLFRLLAGLVAIPLVVGAVLFALDRSELVIMRVWADRPVFTPAFATDRFASNLTPAQTEATLMQEVLGTETFTARVLRTTEPQYESWTIEHRQQVATDLRTNVFVTPEGNHLFVIGYRTGQPDHGAVVLKAIVDAFGSTVQELESGQVATAETALRGQLVSARQDMDIAVTQAVNYQAARHLDDRAAGADPNFNTLIDQARAKTDRYLSLLALIEQAQASRTAVITIQASIFHVVDPPAPVPRAINQSTPWVKYGVLVFAGIAAVEALFVYVVAKRDPSIRSLQDVRRDPGLKPLGSVPVLKRP